MVHLSTVPTIALALGAVLGLGLWLVAASMPRLGRARLVDRVAPYLTDISPEARAMRARSDADPGSVLGLLVLPVARRLRATLSGVLGGNEAIARRLRQAGSGATVERFRGEQLAWAGVAFTIGAALAVLAPSFATMPTVVRVAVPAFAAIAGVVLRDWLLQRSARRRLARISAELPTMLEFLTLSLTAGEGMLDALRRVARAGSGELPTEFARVVAAVGTGIALSDALADLRDGLDHPALTRALDQVLGALDRGAPLAAVLRAQAGDARAEAKRTIIELAGRKEIAMLVPLIFLILPVTIAFALFPGYLVLQAGF
ncbi:type II secretion system F family protein [Agromyces aurantiacus]|uniref:Type II secretion system F family protein n=1 Tax=Agromyces aurantiacus TaxID=165814 RepID=A0ABV9R8T9_9MICO|nr:type II secretion system F family protein [Agromyces aurantiacus]MBM7505175.1 tight adherence protein C [Agromyces aurantiacus]